ncbi:uncharacterized protein LOC108872657 [Scomber scombrus]|uniref:Uncharacterized protein LOC108872657 n=1 Tax=Scomber scombrus TaxID=13677 RepID=A0AAV1Q0I8_SCOSC
MDLSHIRKIFSLGKAILFLVTEAKTNKKRCRHLAATVQVLMEHVRFIQQRQFCSRNQISPNVNIALWSLCITLNKALELVRKCTKTKFMNLLKYKSKFKSVNESLVETYHTLYGALQVQQVQQASMLFLNFGIDDDDDDDDDWLPVPYSAAAAPAPRFLPRPQPPTAVYSAVMGVEGDTLFFAEQLLFTQ